MGITHTPHDILEGIRLIDAGVMIAGTGAGALLGDIGAEVIKIEDPVRGDSFRGFTTQYGDAVSVKGRHVGFETANLNKKSITLDLKNPAGRELLYQLVAKSNAFHTNYSKEMAERLGIDYPTLKKHNPKLVYGVTTLFGTRGPRAYQRGYDTMGQAYSGIMWAMGDRDFNEPVALVSGPFDQQAATLMAFGLMSALMAQQRFGIGQEVHVSVLGGALHIQRENVNMALTRGRPRSRFTRKRSLNPMSNPYRCADGKWIMFAEPQSDRFWGEFCEVVGITHLKNDPRFAVHLGGRSKNNVELIGILEGVFAGKSRDEWIKLLDEKRVGFGYSPIYDLGEAVVDAQVVENDYAPEFDHPVWGKVRLSGFPAWFSETPARIRREAPEHGQHTEEVLMELTGCTWDDIVRLKNERVI